MFGFMKSRKGVEMSMQVVAIAVIVLIIIAVLLYIFSSKSRMFTAATTCDESECTRNPVVGDDCSGLGTEYSPGLMICSYKDPVSGKKYSGKCCGKSAEE